MEDIYAFECEMCGIECFDGEGDGQYCEDCLEEMNEMEEDE